MLKLLVGLVAEEEGPAPSRSLSSLSHHPLFNGSSSPIFHSGMSVILLEGVGRVLVPVPGLVFVPIGSLGVMLRCFPRLLAFLNVLGVVVCEVLVSPLDQVQGSDVG